ncbi:MAG: helix-turn-helix transcriptional regulator [Pseudomonadota bacterium]
MNHRAKRYSKFADQLAISTGADILYMGLFDAASRTFCEHWIGTGRDLAMRAFGDADLAALTKAMPDIAASLETREPLRSHAETPVQPRWITSSPFRVSVGTRVGPLYPVVAVRGGAESGNETMINAFLPVAMSFLAERLEDLAGQENQQDDHLLMTALRALSVHFAVVDSNGVIQCRANMSNDWLVQHGNFEIAGERLVARTRSVQTAFQEALRLATGPDRRSSIVPLRDKSGAVRLVWISQLEQSDQPHALVILGRGKENPALREHLLKLSGLTFSERRVAHQVLRGKSLAETAEETNLALSTVRSYMKRILAKTSTRRQSEFVLHYQGALNRMDIVPSEDLGLRH